MKYYKNADLSTIEYNTVRTNKKKEYINLESAFDIETTSTYINGEKFAFMYVWAFGFGDSDEHVYYGRTWGEYIEFVGMIEDHFQLYEDRILITYVHNLGYEFQFMRKCFTWSNVFSVDIRKPLKALTDNGIEYRDSLMLSGYSLENTAKNLTDHKVEKMVGDLDYSLIRHHETDLTKEEWGYVENDILVVLYYINEQIKQYGDVTKIPLTNTSRVREFVRNKVYYTSKNHRKSSGVKYNNYRKIMNDLKIKDEDEYKQLKRAFQGGFTHANANYSGKVLQDVTSIDFTSSYPAVMLAEQFPMGRAIEVTNKDLSEHGFEYYLSNYCLMFDVKFKNIESKISFENYISESKTYQLTNPIMNNGRVYSADDLATTITDVDYRIIQASYDWEHMEVTNVKRYARGYLPKDFIRAIIELYESKTELKGVEGKEVEYLLSKGMLNSTYGMTVTDIIRETIEYIDEWEIEPPEVDEQLEKYNEGRNRFLFYPWGVWVTAYARKNLWTGILNIGDDYVYSDTDSIKLLNYEKHKPFIQNYDDDLIRKLKRMCQFHDIPFQSLAPKTIEGKEKMIGVWDYEGTFDLFKTLGAKRYMEYDGKNVMLTVAGLSKENGINYMLDQSDHNIDNVFELFNDDLHVPASDTGKMTHTYLDEERTFNITDYKGDELEVYSPSGVHLESVDFTLSISKNYGTFLNMIAEGFLFEGVKEIG